MNKKAFVVILIASALLAVGVEYLSATPPCYAPARFSAYGAGSYYAADYARKFEDQEFRYRVGDYLRTKALREQLLDRAADRLIDRSEALAREDSATPAATRPPLEPSPPAPPTPVTTEPIHPAPPTEAEAVESAVQELATKNCITCHNGHNEKTDLDLRDIGQVRERACKVWAMVDLGLMPPPGPTRRPLSNSDTAKFRLWMASLIEGGSQ